MHILKNSPPPQHPPTPSPKKKKKKERGGTGEFTSEFIYYIKHNSILII